MKVISFYLFLPMLLKQALETRNLSKKIPKVQFENNSMLWTKRQNSSPPRFTSSSKRLHILENLSKILSLFFSLKSQNISLHLGLGFCVSKMSWIFVVQRHYKLELFVRGFFFSRVVVSWGTGFHSCRAQVKYFSSSSCLKEMHAN